MPAGAVMGLGLRFGLGEARRDSQHPMHRSPSATSRAASLPPCTEVEQTQYQGSIVSSTNIPKLTWQATERLHSHSSGEDVAQFDKAQAVFSRKSLQALAHVEQDSAGEARRECTAVWLAARPASPSDLREMLGGNLGPTDPNP